jgi:hypothetical protein
MKNNKLVVLLIILIILIIPGLFLYFGTLSTFNSSKQVYFIHIPKNAGTSVEELFKKNGINVGKYLEDRPGFECREFHILPKFKKNINFKNYITFCVVRDPVDRLVSEVNYVSTGDIEKKHKIKNINDYVKEHLNKKPYYWSDCHLVPQSDYLYDSYGNKVENILQFNNLKNDLTKFIKKYNLNIDINKLKFDNQSDKKFKRSDLTPESIKIIREYYKDDFKLIN